MGEYKNQHLRKDLKLKNKLLKKIIKDKFTFKEKIINNRIKTKIINNRIKTKIIDKKVNNVSLEITSVKSMRFTQNELNLIEIGMKNTHRSFTNYVKWKLFK